MRIFTITSVFIFSACLIAIAKVDFEKTQLVGRSPAVVETVIVIASN